MENGYSAEEALNILLKKDNSKSVRQVAMIDVNGSVSAHTVGNWIYAAGHKVGPNFSVQANLIEKETVWMAMANASEKTEGDLAEKMMSSLEAAENEGGDLRAKQSASLLIITGEPTGIESKDIIMDISVHDHKEPLKELRRLIRIHKAYQHSNKGDHYLEIEKISEALKEYEKASQLYSENPELPYWSAVALASKGSLNKALPIFSKVYKDEPKLKTLTPRLIKSGLLPNENNML